MDFNQIFYWCVDTLKYWAKEFNMTYEEINVWLFVIIYPLVLLALIIVVLVQKRKIRILKRQSPGA